MSIGTIPIDTSRSGGMEEGRTASPYNDVPNESMKKFVRNFIPEDQNGSKP